MQRLLTGVQPSGKPHLGNYLGVMQKQIAYQDRNDCECIFFIADLHALTTVRDAEMMQQMCIDLVLDYLALGLDPEKVTFFRQSDMPEHAELAWILSTVTPHGLLERAHAYKDAVAKKKKEPTVGLFTYPVLMAADILLYKPDVVPVGQDQKQHLEIARDIATKFNNSYGETFPLPEPEIDEETAIVPGTDGQKMSKSYGNTIPIFAEPAELKKAVMSIETDSTPLEEPKDPNECLVYKLYELVATAEQIETMADNLRAGGYGYGHAKTELLEVLQAKFEPMRQKRIELAKNMDYILEVLQIGATKARTVATTTMDEVRCKVGIKL